MLGDLALDVVLAPARDLATGTDVPGRVHLRQGGSAATTARWLAILGARSTLVTSVGRDVVGRALVAEVARVGVVIRGRRVARARTARIGVLVAPDGERSFVADRGAADLLRPADLREAWFRDIDVLHLPAYSLLGEPLGSTGRHAVELGRSSGAAVSVDLASVGPLLAGGVAGARRVIGAVGPDILFATEAEIGALLERRSLVVAASLAPVVFVKRGSHGTTVVTRSSAGRTERFDVATTPVRAADTTGAGDAFDAGALTVWATAAPDERSRPAVLRRAAVAGQRAAVRQLTRPRPEVALG